jgi:hypothetical protein
LVGLLDVVFNYAYIALPARALKQRYLRRLVTNPCEKTGLMIAERAEKIRA